MYNFTYVHFNSKAKCNASPCKLVKLCKTCPACSPLNALELQKGFSWPFFSCNRNIKASWPDRASPSFVNWSRSSKYNKSGLMTRQGMPNKNVGLFFRKALNPAPEVTASHFGCWTLFIIHLFVEPPRSLVSIRKTNKMCRVEDKKLSYGSCPASGGAELYTAATQNEILCLKQTSEKGQAHFRDMFPDRCMLSSLDVGKGCHYPL